MRALLCWLWLLSGVAGSAAQLRPPVGDAFLALTNLWTAHLTLTGDEWQRMGQPATPARGNQPWSTCTFECAGKTVTNVGVRFKGKAPRTSPGSALRRSFKVDFGRRDKTRTFEGLKELSLNENSKDATRFREALAYDVCRRAGLPSPRTAFAAVYLTVAGLATNQYLGVYTIVESVDNDFLEAHFATKKGLLLKPEGMSGLEDLGENWAAYIPKYQPKSAAKAPEAKRVIELAQLVAQADDVTFERELPKRFDLDNLLRYLAVMAVLANVDSFGGTGENYYLFLPATTGRAVLIPWDLDAAFGGRVKAGSKSFQTDLPVLHPSSSANRLVQRVLAHPKWASAYRQQIQMVLKDAFDPSRLIAAGAQLSDRLQQMVSAESAAAKAGFLSVARGEKESRSGTGQPAATSPFAEWAKLRASSVVDELASHRAEGGPLPKSPSSKPAKVSRD